MTKLTTVKERKGYGDVTGGRCDWQGLVCEDVFWRIVE